MGGSTQILHLAVKQGRDTPDMAFLMRLDRIVPRSNLGPGMPKLLFWQGFSHFWL
jgi:hypothetical protein